MAGNRVNWDWFIWHKYTDGGCTRLLGSIGGKKRVMWDIKCQNF